MTRKRVRQDLRSLLTESCPTCRGGGVVKSSATLAAEVFRAVQAKAADAAGREVLVRVHPACAEYLDAEHREVLQRLAHALDVKITIQAGAVESSRENYEITLR
jgi:Ribonuclease G/E